MSSNAQYFLSIEKFNNIQKDIVEGGKFPVNGSQLQGLIFTPGLDDAGKPYLFVFPVYSNKSFAGGTVIVQNLDAKYAPCPYPPPCS